MNLEIDIDMGLKLKIIDVISTHNTSFHSVYSSRRDTIKLLIMNGADIHIKGEMTLQLACKFGDYELAEYLLDHGADPWAWGSLAISWAKFHNHDHIVKLLNRYM